MLKIFKITLITLGGFFLLFASLQSLSVESSLSNPPQPATQVLPSPTPLSFEEVPNIDDLPLQDNPDVYQDDDPDSVVTMYVTVRKGNASDNTDYTWEEVNAFTKWFFTNNKVVTVGKADAIFQVGDEDGPLPGEVGYGEEVPNATIEIRGASSSFGRQKSYKIELKPNSGIWRGQTTINLNKHIYDPSRFRNKLNFDLMKQIPNMLSLRTQFVHLYVKDETSVPPQTKFVDYGLFTQIEQPNKKYLQSHLLDPNGQLYKTTFFEFFRYSEDIRLTTDPLYNEDAFASKLEIKGNQDHAKLIQMLDDLNNYDIPIEQTFEKYFDQENYFTWLAYNILVGNVDTQSQNFLLYSPGNGNKWYFIPWDYDGSFNRLNRESFGDYPNGQFEYGIANYWGSRLHNRVLRVEKYRQMLDKKIIELMGFLTPERIKSMVDSYRMVTEKYTTEMPDRNYISLSPVQKNLDYESMPSEVQLNYNLYVESLQTSMPFFLGVPEPDGDQLIFSWDESYNYSGEDVSYHFMISTDWEFRNILFEDTLNNKLTTKIPMLEPGEYYWRVLATNENNKTAYPFDQIWDAEVYPHPGMKYLYVDKDYKVFEQ